MSTQNLYANVYSSIIPNCQKVEATKMPYKWINKCRISTHWHIYHSAIKRKEVGLFAVIWMDLESVIQSEVSQKEGK